MTPEDLKTMETLLDLFEHEGWKIFIEEQENFAKSLKEHAYLECESNDSWQQRRGVIGTLDRVLSYEQLIRYAVENQETEGEHNV